MCTCICVCIHVCVHVCWGSTQGCAHAIPAFCQGTSHSLGIILKCQSFPYLSSALSQAGEVRAKQRKHQVPLPQPPPPPRPPMPPPRPPQLPWPLLPLPRGAGKAIPSPLPETKPHAFKAISRRRRVFKPKHSSGGTEGKVGGGGGETAPREPEAV